jgi:hypothetical protein
MSGQSEAERLASLQQRLQSLMAALSNANAPALPGEPPDRPPKPVALTLRLDASRYAKLNARAARYTPRRSFQSIIVEAIDAHLGE